jgi:hypothetical protein
MSENIVEGQIWSITRFLLFPSIFEVFSNIRDMHHKLHHKHDKVHIMPSLKQAII